MSYPIKEWTEGFCCGLGNVALSAPGSAQTVGWIIGRTVAQRRRELLGWMYNEILLPPFPVAGWDREAYPYVHLYADYESGDWTLYAQSKMFQYGAFTLNRESYYTAYAVYGPKERCIYQRISCVDGAWFQWETIEKTHGVSNYKLYTYTDPLWANYDLRYTEDGSIFLGASRPVPVYQ